MTSAAARSHSRQLRYLGPPEIAAAATRSAGGRPISTHADLVQSLAEAGVDAREPFTYVVDLDGWLRLAPRRSEHVACAHGGDVLAAGEMPGMRRAQPHQG